MHCVGPGEMLTNRLKTSTIHSPSISIHDSGSVVWEQQREYKLWVIVGGVISWVLQHSKAWYMTFWIPYLRASIGITKKHKLTFNYLLIQLRIVDFNRKHMSVIQHGMFGFFLTIATLLINLSFNSFWTNLTFGISV